MSHDTCLMCGLSLILIPTIVYGGLTILGVISGGAYGAPSPKLSDQQTTLYRAGHAHAGVLTILALSMQIAMDYARVASGFVWPVRIAVFAVPLLVSGGFFGAAHLPALRWLLYLGAVLLIAVTLTVGIGLLLV
jgi:hypothetical protein